MAKEWKNWENRAEAVVSPQLRNLFFGVLVLAGAAAACGFLYK